MIRELVRTIPHYPKQGIMFRDITTVLKDPAGFRWTIDALVDRYAGQKVEKVVGIEARGFILGAAMAHQLNAGFVPVRKRGKLPGKTLGREYQLEYGSAAVEIHSDAIERGERVLVVDDLIATGGTAEAAVSLVRELGGEVLECAFAIDLPELGGRRRLEALELKVFALCAFEGE